MCGTIQLTVDIIIIVQILMYRKNVALGPVTTENGTDSV